MLQPIMCIAALALTPPTETSELDHALALLDALETTVIAVDYRNLPLRAVVDDLNQRLPAPLWADWKSLERLGVFGDEPITLQLHLTSASTVLGALAISLGDEFERATIEAHAGRFALTTLNGSTPMRLTATYDVRDLLRNESLLQRLQDESPFAADHENAPSDAESESSESVNIDNEVPADDEAPEDAEPEPALPDPANPFGAPPLNLPLPRGPDLPKPVERTLTPGEKLILLITDHVDPEAWMNFGGNRGLITDMDGVLLVTATPSTHRRLHDALRLLRAADPSTIVIYAAIVDLSRSRLDALERHYGSNRSGLIAAVINDDQGAMLWRSVNPVALDERLEIESIAEQTQVRVALQPRFDDEAGALRIAIDAGTSNDDKRRQVKTDVSLNGDETGVLIELPAAQSTDAVRVLALTVRRR